MISAVDTWYVFSTHVRSIKIARDLTLPKHFVVCLDTDVFVDAVKSDVACFCGQVMVFLYWNNCRSHINLAINSDKSMSINIMYENILCVCTRRSAV